MSERKTTLTAANEMSFFKTILFSADNLGKRTLTTAPGNNARKANASTERKSVYVIACKTNVSEAA